MTVTNFLAVCHEARLQMAEGYPADLVYGFRENNDFLKVFEKTPSPIFPEISLSLASVISASLWNPPFGSAFSPVEVSSHAASQSTNFPSSSLKNKLPPVFVRSRAK